MNAEIIKAMNKKEKKEHFPQMVEEKQLQDVQSNIISHLVQRNHY